MQFTVKVGALPESTFSVVDFQLYEELDHQRESYQHYDYPGRFKKDLSGHRLDAQRVDAVTGQGSSNSGALMPGSAFTLTDHPNPSIFQPTYH